MLAEAVEKREQSGRSILYLNQDMREFELYGTVRAVISLCDTMNYLTEYDDLVNVCRLVNNYLDPNGIFLFDLKTDHYFKSIGCQSFCDADCEEAVSIKADENSGVAWFSPEEALKKSTEPWFVERVYAKLIEKTKKERCQ